ncbi:MAG: glycosyltransferase family 2 protein [Candidatus Roizmanbacteria bacterium]
MIRPSAYILIAAFEEATVIGQVIADCQKAGYDHVIIVDDGSSDITGDIARQAGGIVLTHVLNCGKSASISTGLRYIQSLAGPDDIVVLIDADGQHLPSEITLLVQPLLTNTSLDLTYGVRTLTRDTPLINRLGRILGDWISILYTGKRFEDSQCGFRALRLRTITGLELGIDRYAIETQMLRHIVEHHLTSMPVKISNVYTSYSKNKHHKQGVMQGLKTLVSLAQ